MLTIVILAITTMTSCNKDEITELKFTIDYECSGVETEAHYRCEMKNFVNGKSGVSPITDHSLYKKTSDKNTWYHPAHRGDSILLSVSIIKGFGEITLKCESDGDLVTKAYAENYENKIATEFRSTQVNNKSTTKYQEIVFVVR